MLIDLGEERSPVTAGPRAPSRPARTAGLLLALAALVLCGGATVPDRPALVPLASVPARAVTAVEVAARDLYVAADDPPAVTGYALPGGHRRWRAPVPLPVAVLSLAAAARVVLATGEGAGATRLDALDAATGALLWSRTGASLLDLPPGRDAPAADHALVRWAGEAGVDVLAWVALRGGEPAWTHPVPAQADVGVSHAPGRPTGAVLATDPDGAAVLLAEDTGAVLARGQVGSLAGDIVLTPGAPGDTPAPAGERLPVEVLGRQFLVEHRRGAGTGWLTGFDMDTLARRWTLTGDLLGAPFPCGQLLCLGSARGIRAVDGSTGAVRWSTDRWQYAEPLDSHRLLAYTAAGSAVLDAGTGRPLWLVDPQWTDLVLGRPGTQGPSGFTGEPRPALLRRRDARDPARYWLAPLAPDTRPLGYLTGVAWPSCAVAGDLLACPTRDGHVGVWRHPVSY